MTERWKLGDRTAVYGATSGYLFRLPTRELADQVIADHNAAVARLSAAATPVEDPEGDL